MSLLAELSPKKGSTHKKHRVGRGSGSGWGGTSGKGHKGQKARSGGGVRWGFEGGQMPIQRRLPKFGFNNKKFETTYVIMGLDKLAQLGGDVNPEILVEKGLISKKDRLKILANGSIDKAVNVKAHKFSKAAKEAIEKAGGKAEVI